VSDDTTLAESSISKDAHNLNHDKGDCKDHRACLHGLEERPHSKCFYFTAIIWALCRVPVVVRRIVGIIIVIVIVVVIGVGFICTLSICNIRGKGCTEDKNNNACNQLQDR
jgi:hypothetical protein